MITFHPTATRLRDGTFRPMVMLRNSKGAMIGSKVARSETYPDKDMARTHARLAAHTACQRIAAQGHDFATRVA